ncbi:helix-turn-helix transcriptional regulator [Anatilimnocola aggregata]|nr:WYL domain-containing protein [Anatilimnocola aggregata]
MKLLGMLQGGQAYNAQALAELCGVTRRTIFRDLEALRDADVPLQYDEQRGSYQIPGHFFLPPTQFTTEEAFAMLVLSRQMGDRRSIPFYAAAQSAADKLANTLPQRFVAYLRSVTSAVRIRLDATNSLVGQERIYEQLLAAISSRCCVRMRYESLHEQRQIQTKLHPYRLLFHQHSWYVIGRSSVHREVRTFNVSRIRKIQILEEPLRMPKNFRIESHLRNAWRLNPEPGPDRNVKIRFSPKVARNVEEVQWHKTQQTQRLEDGALDFTVTVSGLQEISWWILGYADEAEVIEPLELREIIRQRAERLLAVYKRPT